jgi:hypothetical protein
MFSKDFERKKKKKNWDLSVPSSGQDGASFNYDLCPFNRKLISSSI